MPETSTDNEHSTDAAIDLEHVTVENEDAPDACTMYPRKCSEAEMPTHWITALEGSFVSVAEMR